ncbi:MAG: hypothetical protein LBU76_01365, partial [Azoarcus sp.]|nr:hypothetical protein [Azoarcus sp.]
MEKSVTSLEEHGTPREICGDRGIGNVVRELWDRAAPGLNRRELEWFAGSIENGALLLEHMADTMEKVGIHIGFCGTESANDWYGGGRAEA